MTNMEEMTLWEHLVEADHAYVHARMLFLSADIDHVSTLRSAIRNHQGRSTAVSVVKYLNESKRKALLPDLLYLCSWPNGAREAAERRILELPYQWLVVKIESAMVPFLQGEDAADAYVGFLSLLDKVDRVLARRLAGRALDSGDLICQEIATAYLQELGAPGASTSVS